MMGLILLAASVSMPVRGAVLPQLQQEIRAQTFEVVMKKPDNDPVSYEKPLPLELLPFHERNDHYQSIGTAFALGHNRYVTAAHVLALDIDGQYGPPQLRASDGTVYAIDRILKYSIHEDFVLFSLERDPNPAGFAVNREPKIDDPVLAVGNALGEGIVIRDGLYTSATEEDQDGRWKWIRFSAAASPGNSGGPLLDGSGQVIGIVIGKSPNENLNYSLPIGRVLDAAERKAQFDQRLLASLPFMQGKYTYAYQDSFDLPLAWPAFGAAYQAVATRHADAARNALLKTYAASMFPAGPGSSTLIADVNPNEFRPYLIAQQPDGAWAPASPEFTTTTLPADGSVAAGPAAGALLLQVIRPARGADDAFYGDSRAFMDMALKALNLRRAVGQDQVRVTSLGGAKSDELFVDPLARRWQERVWSVPFLNVYVVGHLLPTPDGYVAILQYAPSVLLQSTKAQGRLLTGQLGVSLSGTLAQWQSYLRRGSLLPDAFLKVQLEKSPDWTLRTKRFSSAIPASVLDLTDKSILTLTMGYSLPEGRLRWDIAETWWNKDDRKEDAVGLWRRARPADDARLELRNRFQSMREQRSPFDGQLNHDSAESFSVSRILEVPGKTAGKVSADVLYGVTVRMAGHPSYESARNSMQSILGASRVLEHGVGTETAAAPAAQATAESPLREFARQSVTQAETMDSALGPDIRGHRLSQDVRDFLATQEAAMLRVPLGSAAEQEFNDALRERLNAFQVYWHEYPALTHNRDLWTSFLARNGLPANTPHDAAVATAEHSLLAALDGGVPDAQWSELAKALRLAYIDERTRVVRERNFAPGSFRPRVSPCPPAPGKTSGTRLPAVARTNRSLEEFWPVESKRLGEEGLVKIAIHVSDTGCAMDAAIAGSSGSEMLDDAVMRFYEVIDFYPAEIDGKAANSSPVMPVIFKLR